MTINKALIGHTGFIGGTLSEQIEFNDLYNSSNISKIKDRSYDIIYCAGAQGKKWWANSNPKQDLAGIHHLISHLNSAKAELFVLISTVDVFANPNGVNETTPVTLPNLTPYGYHRFLLEEFVRSKFNNYKIIRLPGLVGTGLRKNIIYDLAHSKLINFTLESSFQFYPVTYLADDILRIINKDISLIHLTSEPISVQQIIQLGFQQALPEKHEDLTQVLYDFQSLYAEDFPGSTPNYQYTSECVYQHISYYKNAIIESSRIS